MHGMGESSWQVVVDEPDDVHLVLFLRDAFRLISPAGAPGALLPAVPDMSGKLGRSIRSAAAAAWPAWWQIVLDSHGSRQPRSTTLAAAAPPAPAVRVDPPDFTSLTATPEL